MTGTAISGNDLVATRLCKIDGCPHDAVDRMGGFAGLCAQHKRDAVKQRTEQMAAGKAADPTYRERISRTVGARYNRDRVPDAKKKIQQARQQLRRANEALDRAAHAIELSGEAQRVTARAHKEIRRALELKQQALAAQALAEMVDRECVMCGTSFRQHRSSKTRTCSDRCLKDTQSSLARARHAAGVYGGDA